MDDLKTIVASRTGITFSALLARGFTLRIVAAAAGQGAVEVDYELGLVRAQHTAQGESVPRPPYPPRVRP